jgi:GGDEF domain-containing protein
MIGPPANAANDGEIAKLRRLVVRLNLTGLANDTKWEELLTAMRSKAVWVPKFRYRCIDSDFVSSWDGEWLHHVPMPMISVAWMDLRHFEFDRHLPPRLIYHSVELCELLDRIGLDYTVGDHAIRIFGYAPRDMTQTP